MLIAYLEFIHSLLLLQQSHGAVCIQDGIVTVKTDSLSVVFNGFIITTLLEAPVTLCTHRHQFNGNFPGKSGLYGFPLILTLHW